MKRVALLACSALVAVSAAAFAAHGQEVVTQPAAHGIVSKMMDKPQPVLSDAEMTALVRHKIKYVFVLYQENRSFDSYFGTFPGADGLYSQPAAKTPGFVQELVNTDGSTTTISPFRIGPKQYAWDTDDIDHSHGRIIAKMDVVAGKPLMDKFAVTEEKKYSPSGNPSLKAKQFGELAMAYEDCDTVPFLWRYASRFVLFDHVFQDIAGPSTPGNLSIFAAQTGLTQWALHPNEATGTYKGGPTATNAAGGKISEAGAGVPVVTDDDPLWGSPLDPHPAVPANPHDFASPHGTHVQINQTYASLALTTAGKTIKRETARDTDPDTDLADVRQDVAYLAAHGQKPVGWGWYEEGYGKDAGDRHAGPTDAQGMHAAYITHHNGPQYFGYVANNPAERDHLHGASAFYTALRSGALPASGGVFYLKGGFRNDMGLTPDNPDAKARKNFVGDDDHPAYSDAQISEAFVAKAVNAIARSKYWKHAAIIITWDDSEGDYDHVPPPVVIDGPDHKPLTFGPRVPLIMISPYARVHQISHAVGSQASVVKFVDKVFGLTPLARLPDEMKGRRLGQKEFGEANIGPADAITPDTSDLMTAFDPARLEGQARALPPSYAIIPDHDLTTLPQFGGNGCKVDGIVPTNITKGIRNKIPADFNPLPKTNPST
ncbi:unnamed protein product [Acidocella sp. C78]|uniref:phospholipase C n=1 Tax=Acidocella sp. C78 TaxID=1671486 RepID=UPI00191BB655|nr:alkaline phosphatase family protein [Acidocella sp. C78]CAG4906201.1 unnamed protein product [Acidocella sp. C78]